MRRFRISSQNLAIIGMIVALVAVMHVMFPLFLTPLNMESIAMAFIFEGIIALGMTFVIITGGIDLSVCSMLPFAEIICAKLMTQAGVPMWPAVMITLAIGAAVGILNGVMIKLLDIHPMIVTMATMLILRGTNLAITNGKAIAGFSDAFLTLGQGKVFGVNIPIVYFAILAFALGLLLNNHKFFRQIYFIGNNEKAAALSGINVDKVKIFFYMLCAMLAASAGILAASKYGAAHWVHGNGSEVKAISSVAIGGASLYGGSGKMGSTVIGVIFLAVINNAFVMSGMNTFWFDVVNGSMLIAAIMISYYATTQNERRLLKVKYEKLINVKE
ncbi:MAG: ABC transporter permease [Synergistaceae bacterium]|jgi:ribose transport system permease protein|nr:ABC transporter permease [Synergistaceae bacterium]